MKKGNKFLSILVSLLLAISMFSSISVFAEEETTANDYIDLYTFLEKLKDNNGTLDGSASDYDKLDGSEDGVLTVKWDATSCAVTNNTNGKVNSNMLQYFVGSSNSKTGTLTNISISNVNFTYTPGDFTLNNTSYISSTCTAAQLYFMNCGNLTVDNCTFNKVVLTHFLECSDITHYNTITNCTFDNTDTGQAGIKDLRGSYITVDSCTFIGCETGIRISQSSSSVNVYSVKLTNNCFKDMATSSTNSSYNLFDLADPTGNYSSASIVIDGNTSSETPLSNGTMFSIKEDLVKNGNFSLALFTGDITELVNSEGKITYQDTWSQDLGQDYHNKITFQATEDSDVEATYYVFDNTKWTLPDESVITIPDGYYFAGWQLVDSTDVLEAGASVILDAYSETNNITNYQYIAVLKEYPEGTVTAEATTSTVGDLSITAQIDEDALAKATLTEEEQYIVYEQGGSATYTLSITESSVTTLENDLELGDTYTFGEAFKLSLSVTVKDMDGTVKSTRTITDIGDEAYTLTVELSDDLINSSDSVTRTYKIAYLDSNGDTQFIAADYDEDSGTLTFSTNVMTSYAIVYYDTVVTDDDSINNGTTENSNTENTSSTDETSGETENTTEEVTNTTTYEESDEESTDTTTETTSSTSSTSETTETGDSTNIMLWVTLLGLALVAGYNIKKKYYVK